MIKIPYLKCGKENKKIFSFDPLLETTYTCSEGQLHYIGGGPSRAYTNKPKLIAEDTPLNLIKEIREVYMLPVPTASSGGIKSKKEVKKFTEILIKDLTDEMLLNFSCGMFDTLQFSTWRNLRMSSSQSNGYLISIAKMTQLAIVIAEICYRSKLKENGVTSKAEL